VIDLDFAVEGAEAVAHAALPTLALKLRITTPSGHPVRGMSLAVQVRIVAPQRGYTPTEQEHLLDVFGDPSRWGQTLKSLLWTIAHLQVPAFRGQTTVDLPIHCTYDFEVVAAKYLDALADGEIPLELLFSGTVFYVGGSGLQVEQIAWDREARFRLPVRVWRDVMQRYFPNSAWLTLHKDTFDRLHQYRTRHALPTWDATVEQLLGAAEAGQAAIWTR
jgi:hypothetical protein